MSREPDASVLLRHGDNLTLICSIQPDPSPAVDSDVVVTGRLQGAGRNSTIVTTSDGVYKVMLHIPSLRATSSDTYTCTGTVEPGSGVMYVQRSESCYSLYITVGMQLLISLRMQLWHLTLDHNTGLCMVRMFFVLLPELDLINHPTMDGMNHPKLDVPFKFNKSSKNGWHKSSKIGCLVKV